VLVATNLAARGLDSCNVSHVIQYEFAKTTVDYYHRVGRLARMGQKGGLVTSFIRPPQDSEIAQNIAKSIVDGGDMDEILSHQRHTSKKKRSTNNN